MENVPGLQRGGIVVIRSTHECYPFKTTASKSLIKVTVNIKIVFSIHLKHPQCYQKVVLHICRLAGMGFDDRNDNNRVEFEAI